MFYKNNSTKKINLSINEFREAIIKTGSCPDYVLVEGIEWEMEEYDLSGKQITYTNITEDKDLIIEWNYNRYKSWDDIKQIYIEDKISYRNGFNYSTGKTPQQKETEAQAKQEKKQKMHRRMFENIYDLIKGGEFEETARNELRAFIWHKNIEWDKNLGIISLGRDFKIKLLTK
jgi:hypothetical protein